MEHKGAYGEDKFYLRPTNHVTVHGGAIPIQQPPQVTLKLLFFVSLPVLPFSRKYAKNGADKIGTG